MKRASYVPPQVDSGRCPVSGRAPATARVNEIDERPPARVRNTSAFDGSHSIREMTAGRGSAGALLDQRLNRGLVVAVVEADVEARAPSPGMTFTVGLPTSTEVNSRFEGSKCSLPRIKRVGHDGAHDGDDAAHRIIGERRVGDMALRPFDDQRAVLGQPGRPILRMSPSRRGIGRFAEEAVVECLAARRRPLQQFYGAVVRRPPSSSPVMRKEIEPLGAPPLPGKVIASRPPARRRSHPSCQRHRGRVLRRPSISPANGWCRHWASSPGGKTSVCPANTRCGLAGADAGVTGFPRRAAPGSEKMTRRTAKPAPRQRAFLLN